MFNATIDLGQTILGLILSVIAIIGWFIKREIITMSVRLDLHDKMLFTLSGDIREIKGIVTAGKAFKE